MQKISTSRLNFVGQLAAAAGMAIGDAPTARMWSKLRGMAPAGMKWNSGVYIPGGKRCNVTPAIIRNPKVAANVAMMHDKWLAAFNARQSAA